MLCIRIDQTFHVESSELAAIYQLLVATKAICYIPRFKKIEDRRDWKPKPIFATWKQHEKERLIPEYFRAVVR